jgi:hypothetical protein
MSARKEVEARTLKVSSSFCGADPQPARRRAVRVNVKRTLLKIFFIKNS